MTYISLHTLSKSSGPGPDRIQTPIQASAGFFFRSSLGFLPFDEEQKNAVCKENAPRIFTALLPHLGNAPRIFTAFSEVFITLHVS